VVVIRRNVRFESLLAAVKGCRSVERDVVIGIALAAGTAGCELTNDEGARECGLSSRGWKVGVRLALEHGFVARERVPGARSYVYRIAERFAARLPSRARARSSARAYSTRVAGKPLTGTIGRL
jgi:hypothetical protein